MEQDQKDILSVYFLIFVVIPFLALVAGTLA